MKRPLTLILALGATLLGGCGGDSRDGTARTPTPATLAGVYAGEFPCSNCAAIEATLWLRPDGGFVLRQQFLDDPAAPSSNAPRGPSTTYGLGRWNWDDVSAEVILRGRGPERRLVVRDEGELQLRVASPIDHVLERDATAPRFGDRLTLDGESAVRETGASFKECASGLTFSVADAGAYRELRRQHQRMNPRGKVALTTVEGHLITVGNGSTKSERLVVDAFIAIKPGTGC
jgi:NlpE N-terminal domain/NlpE C-terminal OB domain